MKMTVQFASGQTLALNQSTKLTDEVAAELVNHLNEGCEYAMFGNVLIHMTNVDYVVVDEVEELSTEQSPLNPAEATTKPGPPYPAELLERGPDRLYGGNQD